MSRIDYRNRVECVFVVWRQVGVGFDQLRSTAMVLACLATRIHRDGIGQTAVIYDTGCAFRRVSLILDSIILVLHCRTRSLSAVFRRWNVTNTHSMAKPYKLEVQT